MDARTIAILIVSVIFTNARPTCKLLGEQQKDLVCEAGNTDFDLQRGLVSDNNRTTGITLRSCRIVSVDYESFNHLFSLEYLDLSMNKIALLKLGVLDETPRVTFLNLSHNILTGFPLGLFDEKPNLEILDLKGNKINSLELGVFDPLSKLKHLDLSSNELLGKDLNPYIFDRSPSIGFMDFSRNDMRGSPDILLHAFQSLNFLNLDRCSLTEIPAFALSENLKTMKHLMLSSNLIEKIDNPSLFKNLENLEILNIAFNMIDTVNANVFKTLRRLKMIVLNNNKLTNIPDSLFKNMDMLMNIDLSYNMIEYVPVNAFRGSSAKNLNLSHNRFTYLSDNFCLELKNSGARIAKFFFNNNPWQCACLRDTLKEVKSMGVKYNSVKYNGKERVCVTTDEFNCKRHQNFNKLYVEMYHNQVES